MKSQYKKGQPDAVFGDKLRPKTWEELIILQVNRCLEDLRESKDAFINSVKGLEYLTLFLHKFNKDFTSEMRAIDQSLDNEMAGVANKQYADRVILGFTLQKFGLIVEILNKAGMQPMATISDNLFGEDYGRPEYKRTTPFIKKNMADDT